MNINEFDLAFVIDTTGSMGSFIAAAQRQMVEIVQALTDAKGVDIRVAIVEYRDHPPQDRMLTRTHDFSGDLKSVQKNINKLAADGGGDEPEAVYDGLRVCSELDWRDHARRVAVLIGDAPPHARCLCGDNEGTISAKLEGASIKLYSVPLTRSVEQPFGLIAHLTGGTLCGGADGRQAHAVTIIKQLLEEEFGKLDLDRRVHTLWHKSEGEMSTDDMSKELDTPPSEIDESLGRLGTRDLLRIKQPA